MFEVGGFDSSLLDEADERGDTEDKKEKIYTCIRCGSPIAPVHAEREIDGSFTHSFTNPHGIMFSIGCFSEAPGCVAVGPSTAEFTWFPGYSWRICGCGVCGMHLGWEFFAEESGFFGLILDNLSI